MAYGVSLLIRSIRSRKLSRGLASNPSFYILFAIVILMVALQVCHALGRGLKQSAWWYLLAVTWLLVSAVYRFFFVLGGWVRSA